MKEIVSKILEVIMCLIPFFGKGKRERVVREVRYNAYAQGGVQRENNGKGEGR